MQNIIIICISVIMAVANIAFIVTRIDRKKLVFSAMSIITVEICCVGCIINNITGIYPIFTMVLTACLNLVAIYDIKTKFIPNILLLALNTIGLLSSFFVPDGFFLKTLVGAWCITGLCFIVGRKTKGGIGSGDLFCMSGLMMSMNFGGMMNFMFTTLFLGVIYSIATLISKKTTLKTEIPFAPFMLAGYLCMILFI